MYDSSAHFIGAAGVFLTSVAMATLLYCVGVRNLHIAAAHLVTGFESAAQKTEVDRNWLHNQSPDGGSEPIANHVSIRISTRSSLLVTVGWAHISKCRNIWHKTLSPCCSSGSNRGGVSLIVIEVHICVRESEQFRCTASPPARALENSAVGSRSRHQETFV